MNEIWKKFWTWEILPYHMFFLFLILWGTPFPLPNLTLTKISMKTRVKIRKEKHMMWFPHTMFELFV